jgi:DTW domain-containing protein
MIDESTTDEPSVSETPTDCPRCRKPLALCICDSIAPIDNKVALLILQHPQEQDRALGTARLAAMSLKNAQLKVGLSWPNLGKLVGRPVEAQRWAVLYLGSTTAKEIAPDREVVLVDRKGEAERDQDEGLRYIEGIVLLDGTWSQAKALWWRNAWMLKCKRVVLNPKRPSRYGKVRREPRPDALSTIESAALLLSRIEHRPEIETALTETFERMLAKFRESGVTIAKAANARGGPRRDYRRRRPQR